ncbi:hypothetical protein QOT17_008936 [Balamuthia mandrillaris]
MGRTNSTLCLFCIALWLQLWQHGVLLTAAADVWVANTGECSAVIGSPCQEGPLALKQALEAGSWQTVWVKDGYEMSAAVADNIAVHPNVEKLLGEDPGSVIRLSQNCPSAPPLSPFAFFSLSRVFELRRIVFEDYCSDAGAHTVIKLATANFDVIAWNNYFKAFNGADVTFINVAVDGWILVDSCTFQEGSIAIDVSSSSATKQARLHLWQCSFYSNARDFVASSTTATNYTKIDRCIFSDTLQNSIDIRLAGVARIDLQFNIFSNIGGSAMVIQSFDTSFFSVKNSHVTGCQQYAVHVLSPMMASLDLKHNNMFGNNGAAASGGGSGTTAQIRVEGEGPETFALDGNYWGEGTSRELLYNNDQAFRTRLGAPLLLRETPRSEIGPIGFEYPEIDLEGLQASSIRTDDKPLYPWSVGIYASAPFAQPFFPMICTPFFQIRYVPPLEDNVTLSISMPYNQTNSEDCVRVVEAAEQNQRAVPVIWYYSLNEETALPEEGGGWMPLPASHSSLDTQSKRVVCQFDSTLESPLVRTISRMGIALAVFLMEPTEHVSTRNGTELAIITRFVSHTPNFVLQANEPSQQPEEGGEKGAGVSLFAEFASATEINAEGDKVVSKLLPKENFSSTSDDGSFFSAVLPEGARLEWSFENLPQGSKVSFADVIFPLEQDATKWSILVENWDFQQDNNSLRLLFKLFPQSPFTSKEEDASRLADSGLTRHVLRSETAATTAITIGLLDFALVDGEKRGIATEFSEDLSYLAFTFPSFQQRLQYDPDLGLLFEGQANGNGDDKDEDDAEVDIILMVVVPVVVVVVAAVAVVLAGLLLYKKIYTRNIRLSKFTGGLASSPS